MVNQNKDGDTLKDKYEIKKEDNKSVTLNEGSKKSEKESLKDYKLEILLILLIIIEIIVNKNVICLSFIQGESMEPTLYDKDIVVTYKPLIYNNKYYYGDIVVITAKRVENTKFFQRQYIKRIIGMPGDTIRIENGRVYRNGKELKESYIADKAYTDIYGTRNVWELNNNEYFLMGDNRYPYMSLDSRYFGPIYKKEIMGKTYKRIYSKFDNKE